MLRPNVSVLKRDDSHNFSNQTLVTTTLSVLQMEQDACEIDFNKGSTGRINHNR